MLYRLLNPLAVIISLSTLTGVLLHDMHLDKAAMTAMSLPPVLASYDTGAKLASLGNDPHTHVERSSLAQAISALSDTQPRVQPRAGEDKKHLLQRYARRSALSFGEYHVPLT